MSYTFNVSYDYASIHFHNNEKVKDSWAKHQPHYPILHRVLNFMQERGFQVGRDPRIERDYKILTKDHWYGQKDDLEFKAERYPAGWKIEFFQNINIENKAGGYYDFDKYDKMPYLIKLLFRNEVRHLKEFLVQLGHQDDSKPIYKLASDKVKAHLVEDFHKPQKSMEEFELKDLDGQTDPYDFNRLDRDNKIIYNGQVKYFRDWNGRLMRGIVYHNINNMWWVIINKFKYTNMADFKLFDPTPEDFRARRLKRDVKPEKYLKRKEKLQEASSRELLNELKRRGVKIAG